MRGNQLTKKGVLVSRLRWTCHLRAVGSCGLLGIVLCGKFLAGLNFPLGPIIFLIAGSLVYDAAILATLEVWRRKRFCRESLIYHLVGNVAGSLDVLGLTAMVYFTGGSSSPWVYYPVIGTVTAAALFPWYHALLFTLLSASSLSLLFFAESWGLLEPVTIAAVSPSSSDAGYLVTMLLSLVAFMSMSAYMVSFPAGREREYQKRLDLEARRAKLAARQSRSLLRVLRHLSALGEAREVADVLAADSLQLIGCRSTAVLLWDRKIGKYKVASVWEEGRGRNPRFDGLEIDGAAMPLLEAPAFTSLVGTRVGGLGDAAGDHLNGLRHLFRSCFAVPLGTENKRLGLLLLGLGEAVARLAKAQQRMARGVAYQGATALENTELLRDLRRASELKSQFAANISHELRTPLHIITGCAELMEAGSFGPVMDEQKNACRIVLDSASQLLRIVDAALEINQMDLGASTVSLERVYFQELWQELQVELETKEGVAVEWEQRQGVEWVVTDVQKLKMILKQLLGNAIEYTEKGVVRATLGIDHGARSFVVEVQDTGAGIAKKDLPEIFDMFTQVDGSLTRRHGGLGLGLYLVKRLVEELSGSIDVQSSPGSGSCFTVRLPLNEEAQDISELASASAG